MLNLLAELLSDLGGAGNGTSAGQGVMEGGVGGAAASLMSWLGGQSALQGGMDPSVLSPLLSLLPQEDAALLQSALAEPGMMSTLLSMMGSLEQMTAASEGNMEDSVMAIVTNDATNPLVRVLGQLTDLLTRQNVLGTSTRPPLLYYVEEAMADTQYLLRRSCEAPVPPPFNETPFRYECVPTEMVYESSPEAMSEKLFCGWKSGRQWLDCRAEPLINAYMNAFEFKAVSDSSIDVEVSFNGSGYLRGSNRGPGAHHRTQESMNVVTDAFLKFALGNDNVGASIRSLKEMPKLQTSLDLDFASVLGPLLYMLTLQLLFPVMLQQLVYEKHNRLRIMMKMHGLKDGVYWLVTYLWYLMLSVVYFLILVIFGSAIGLKFFTTTSPAVMVLFFFVFSNTQIAFSFLLSAIFRNPRTAVTFGFIYVFALSFMANFLLGNLVDSRNSVVVFLELVPAFSLFRGLYEFSSYSFMAAYQGTMGMTFAKFSDEGNGMVEVILILLFEFPVFMGLAWYLEQVLGQVRALSSYARLLLMRLYPTTGNALLLLVQCMCPASLIDLPAGLLVRCSGRGPEALAVLLWRAAPRRDHQEEPGRGRTSRRRPPQHGRRGCRGGAPEGAGARHGGAIHRSPRAQEGVSSSGREVRKGERRAAVLLMMLPGLYAGDIPCLRVALPRGLPFITAYWFLLTCGADGMPGFDNGRGARGVLWSPRTKRSREEHEVRRRSNGDV